MWLSTKSKYGLRAIFEVGLHYGEGPISISAIADKYGISQAYLEQIFSLMKKGGLIVSKRGQSGGYILSREPAQITIGDILRPLENSFTPSECEVDDKFCCSGCITGSVFKKINEGINSVIDNFTLQDLIDEREEMTEGEKYFMEFLGEHTHCINC